MNHEPEFIYICRNGSKAKDLRLNREQDWLTGLSFSTEPQPVSLKFSVEKLRAAGYVVRFDGGQQVYQLFTNKPVGENRYFHPAHVTIYLPNRLEWDAWYEADVKLRTVPGAFSEYAERLFDLRERDEG